MNEFLLRKIEIFTNRFLLRPLTPADATEQYSSWFENADAERFIVASKTPHAVHDLKAYIQKKMEDPNVLFLGIFDRNTSQHIGNIKYEPVNRNQKYATMGILIGEGEWRGKGVAAEVIRGTSLWLHKELGINKIVLGVNNENLNAIRAYEKIGFKIGDTPYIHQNANHQAMIWELGSLA